MLSTWLDEHLETFVRPVLKKIPNVEPNPWVNVFTIKKLNIMRGVWVQTKRLAKHKMILLAGRDVFLFEVLARMEGTPTIFRPEISSSVANAKVIKDDFSDCFLLDTGYKGSVPKALGVPDWRMISYQPYVPATKADLEAYQLFPRMKRNLGITGTLEGCPKYWNIGMVRYDKFYRPIGITQSLADRSMFNISAILTQHVARIVKNPRYSKIFIIRSLGRGI